MRIVTPITPATPLGCIEAFQRWRQSVEDTMVLAWTVGWATGDLRKLRAAADESQRLYLAWCMALLAAAWAPSFTPRLAATPLLRLAPGRGA